MTRRSVLLSIAILGVVAGASVVGVRSYLGAAKVVLGAAKEAAPDTPQGSTPAQLPELPENVARFFPESTKVLVAAYPEASGSVDRPTWNELCVKLYRSHVMPELPSAEPAVREVRNVFVAMPQAGWPTGLVVIRGKVDGKLLAAQARECRDKKKTVSEIGPPDDTRPPIFRRIVSGSDISVSLPKALTTPTMAAAAAMTESWEVCFSAADEETLLLSIAPKIRQLPFGLSGLAKGMSPVNLETAPWSNEREMLEALKARPRETKPRVAPKLVELLEGRDRRAWIFTIVMDDALAPPWHSVPDLKETFGRWKHLTAGMRDEEMAELTIVAVGKDIDSAREMEQYADQNRKTLIGMTPTFGPNPEERKTLDELFRSIRVSREGAVVTVTMKIESQKMRRVAKSLQGPSGR
jgi:hypothetical protein